MEYFNNQAKFKEVTIVSDVKPYSGEKHRSSRNIALCALEKSGYIKWLCPDGITFSVKEDRTMASDPVVYTNIKNGSVTRYIDTDKIYIADPQVNGNWSCKTFTVKIIPLCHGRNWLSQCISPETPIKNINLPGSHDAGAINKSESIPVYTRHRSTITEQLHLGVRILDIRLKVLGGENTSFYFNVCHGDFGSYFGWNEFTTFEIVRKECEDFLRQNPSEFIVMSLKIDDWGILSEKKENDERAAEVYLSLWNMFLPSVYVKFDDYKYKDVQGKIIIINRVHDHDIYGESWKWEHNTSFTVTLNNSVNVSVQDKYDVYSTDVKMEEVRKCIREKIKIPSIFALNFISCVWGVLLLDASDDFMNFLGGHIVDQNQSISLGWFMLDFSEGEYETDKYGKLNVVQAIIDLNMNPHRYYQYNTIVENDNKDEL